MATDSNAFSTPENCAKAVAETVSLLKRKENALTESEVNKALDTITNLMVVTAPLYERSAIADSYSPPVNLPNPSTYIKLQCQIGVQLLDSKCTGPLSADRVFDALKLIAQECCCYVSSAGFQNFTTDLLIFFQKLVDPQSNYHRNHAVAALLSTFYVDGTAQDELWRQSLEVNSIVDMYHEKGRMWAAARVLEVNTSNDTLRILPQDLPGMGVWLNRLDPSIQPAGTKTVPAEERLKETWRHYPTLRLGSKVDCYDSSSSWSSMQVIDIRTSEGLTGEQLIATGRATLQAKAIDQAASDKIAKDTTGMSLIEKSIFILTHFPVIKVTDVRVGYTDVGYGVVDWIPVSAAKLAAHGSRAIGKASFGLAEFSDKDEELTVFAALAEAPAQAGFANRPGLAYGGSRVYELAKILHQQRVFDVILQKLGDSTAVMPAAMISQAVKFLSNASVFVDAEEFQSRIKPAPVNALYNVCRLPENELRSLTSDVVLKLGSSCMRILLRAMPANVIFQLLEQISLILSLRMAGTMLLAQQVQGLKLLSDAIHSVRIGRAYSANSSQMCFWLLKSRILEQLYFGRAGYSLSATFPSVLEPSLQVLFPPDLLSLGASSIPNTEITGRPAHPELLRRTADIVKLLVRDRKASPELLEALWRVAMDEDTQIVDAVLKVFEECTFDFHGDDMRLIIAQIAKLPRERLRYPLVLDLLKRYATCGCQSAQVAPCVVDIFWDIMFDADTVSTVKAKDEVESRFIDSLTGYYNKEQKRTYLHKLAEIINIPAFGTRATRCISRLVESYTIAGTVSDMSRGAIIQQLEGSAHILSSTLRFIRAYKDALLSAIESGKLAADAATEYQNAVVFESDPFTHNQHVEMQLAFVSKLITSSLLTIDGVTLNGLFDLFYLEAVNQQERQAFLQFLADSNSIASSGAFYAPGVAEEFFNSHILPSETVRTGMVPSCRLPLPVTPRDDAVQMSRNGLNAFRAFFLEINAKQGTLDRLSEDAIQVNSQPDEMVGVNHLWEIALHAKDQAVGSGAIALLATLYTEFSSAFPAADVPHIDKVVARKDAKTKCIARLCDALRASVHAASDSADVSQSLTPALRSLQLLHKLLDTSDVNGYGLQVRPHSLRCRGAPLTLKIANSITWTSDNIKSDILPNSFEVHVFENSTVWDVRVAVSAYSGLPPSRMGLTFNRMELTSSSNATSLVGLQVKDMDSMSVFVRPPTTSKPLPLIISPPGAGTGWQNWRTTRMTPGALRALNAMFDRFCVDDHMTKEEFSGFFRACGVKVVDPMRIDKIFNDFHTSNGRMTRQGFIEFYHEASVAREGAVRNDLETHGFDGCFQPITLHTDTPTSGDKAAFNVVMCDTRVVVLLQDYVYNLLHDAVALPASSSEARRVVAAAWRALQRLPTDPAVLHAVTATSNASQQQSAATGTSLTQASQGNESLQVESMLSVLYALQHKVPHNTTTTLPELCKRSELMVLYAMQVLESVVNKGALLAERKGDRPASPKRKRAAEGIPTVPFVLQRLFHPSALAAEVGGDVGDTPAAAGTASPPSGGGGEVSFEYMAGNVLPDRIILTETGATPEEAKPAQVEEAPVEAAYKVDAVVPEQLTVTSLGALPRALRCELQAVVDEHADAYRVLHLRNGTIPLIIELFKRVCTSGTVVSQQGAFLCKSQLFQALSLLLSSGHSSSGDASPTETAAAAIDFEQLEQLLLTFMHDALCLQALKLESDETLIASPIEQVVSTSIQETLKLWGTALQHAPTRILQAMADIHAQAQAEISERFSAGQRSRDAVVWTNAYAKQLDDLCWALLLCDFSAKVPKAATTQLLSLTAWLDEQEASQHMASVALLEMLLLFLPRLQNRVTPKGLRSAPAQQLFSLIDKLVRDVTGLTAMKQANKERKILLAKAKNTGNSDLSIDVEALGEITAVSRVPSDRMLPVLRYLARKVVSHHRLEPTIYADALLQPSPAAVTLTGAPDDNDELDDEVLVGLLQLLATLLDAFPSMKALLSTTPLSPTMELEGAGSAPLPLPVTRLRRSESEVAAEDLARILYEDCLFRVPAIEHVISSSYSLKEAAPKCLRPRSRKAAFKLLVRLVDGNEAAMERLCDKLSDLLKSCAKLQGFKNTVSRLSRSDCGYVGIRNLGCICYMNAMLQQFFMIPHFRLGVLSLASDLSNTLFDEKGALIESTPTLNDDPMRDEMFYQLQRMFSYLVLSDRQDYDPRQWCKAFKDPTGAPTPIGVQQDATEFITWFLDQLERGTSSTSQKDLVNSTCAGSLRYIKACSKCGTQDFREESFMMLKLEIRTVTDLYAALEEYCKEERIDDVMCEKCQEKTTAVRRPLLQSMPNTLILNLNRLVFNYETFQREKINSRVAFPVDLQLYKYACDGQTLVQAEASSTKEDDSQRTTVTEEEKARIQALHAYKLVGVVCHTGTAESGHYYSFINDRVTSKWHEYNDSYVKPFSLTQLESECFGGVQEIADTSAWGTEYVTKREVTKNAYICIYEKVDSPPLRSACEVIRRCYDASAVAQRAEDAQISSPFQAFLQRLCDPAMPSNALWKHAMPAGMYASVATDNIQFARDRAVFSVEFGTFMTDLVSAMAHSLCTTNTEISGEHFVGMILDYLVSVLARVDKAVAAFEGICTSLLTVFDSKSRSEKANADFGACMLKFYCNNTAAVNEVLTAAPEEKVRAALAQLLLGALKAACFSEETQASLKSSELRESCLVYAAMQAIAGALPDALKNWSRFSEYFGLLGKLADVSKTDQNFIAPIDILASAELSPVERLLTALLGDHSPVTSPGAKSPVPSLGGGVLQPAWEPVVTLLAKILLHKTPTAFPRKEVVENGAPAVPLTWSSQEEVLLSQPVLWTKLFSGKFSISMLSQLANKLISVFPASVTFFTHVICSGVAIATADDVQVFMELLQSVLESVVKFAATEDAALEVIACFLGDPHYGTDRAGVGLGMSPLTPDAPPLFRTLKTANYNIADFDGRMLFLSSLGIRHGSGVLRTLHKRRHVAERVVALGLSSLLRIAAKQPLLRRYLFSLPAIDVDTEVRYADWMKRHFMRHWETLHCPAAPVAATPMFTNVSPSVAVVSAAPENSNQTQKMTTFDVLMEDVRIMMELEQQFIASQSSAASGDGEGAAVAQKEGFVMVDWTAGYLGPDTAATRFIDFDPHILRALKGAKLLAQTHDQGIHGDLFEYSFPYDVETADHDSEEAGDYPPTKQPKGYKHCYLRVINGQNVDIQYELTISTGNANSAPEGSSVHRVANHRVPPEKLRRKLRAREVCVIFDAPVIDASNGFNYSFNWKFEPCTTEATEEAAGEGGIYAAVGEFTTASYATVAGVAEPADASSKASDVLQGASVDAVIGKRRRHSDSGTQLSKRPAGASDLLSAEVEDVTRGFDDEVVFMAEGSYSEMRPRKDAQTLVDSFIGPQLPSDGEGSNGGGNSGGNNKPSSSSFSSSAAWDCPACTYINEAAHVFCAVCTTSRP